MPLQEVNQRDINNLTNIATGFLSIIKIPFWLNSANNIQLIIFIENKLQKVIIKRVYFSSANNDEGIIKLSDEKDIDFILVVSLEKLSIWLIPLNVIIGKKIIRLGKNYSNFKHSIVDSALKHSTKIETETSDKDYKEAAKDLVRTTRSSKFQQLINES